MIRLDQLGMHFGSKVLFEGLNALVHPHDRIGLVGANGTGKSTLLRMLAGLEAPETGRIEQAGYVTVGYLPQEGMTVAGRSLFAEMETAFPDLLAIRHNLEEASARLHILDSASEEYRETLELIGEWEHRLEDLEADRARAKIERILHGLGFEHDDLDRGTAEFSGGWQMRIALAKLLLREPSLLLLDEPTNHLDLETLRWLEKYLRQYDGALIMVSHDQAFLDAVTERTFALHHRRLEIYAGNFSFFVTESAKRRELLGKAVRVQAREIARLERFVERFHAKATKASQARSRARALAKIDRLEVEEEESAIDFQFPPAPRSGDDVLTIRGLRKAYGERLVFDGLNLSFQRGDRLAIVGPNGAGKSTLARILAGVEPFQEGLRSVGANVSMSYFAQHQAEELDPDREVLEIAAEGQPLEVRLRVRHLLGAFLFRGDDVFKKARVLSGGEKSRLALARLLLKPCNCLILDEPTNHLDMRSKAVLQEALLDYEGTLLIVSHDRDFLDPLVTELIEVRPGGVRRFPGALSEFMARLDEEEAASGLARSGPSDNVGTSSAGGETGAAGSGEENARQRRRREAQLRQRLAPLRQALAAAESAVEQTEAAVATWEAAMLDPGFFKRGEETSREVRAYEADKVRLADAWAAWESAQKTLEAAQSGDALVSL